MEKAGRSRYRLSSPLLHQPIRRRLIHPLQHASGDAIAHGRNEVFVGHSQQHWLQLFIQCEPPEFYSRHIRRLDLILGELRDEAFQEFADFIRVAADVHDGGRAK